jgi:hypothetical protein
MKILHSTTTFRDNTQDSRRTHVYMLYGGGWCWYGLGFICLCNCAIMAGGGCVPCGPPCCCCLLLLLLLQRQHLLPHSLLLELVLLRLNPRLHSLGRLPRVRGRRSALRPHAAHRVHVSVHRDVWRLLQVLGARGSAPWRGSPAGAAWVGRSLRQNLKINDRYLINTLTLLLACEHVGLASLHHLLPWLHVVLHHGAGGAGVVAVRLVHAALHGAVLLRKHILEKQNYFSILPIRPASILPCWWFYAKGLTNTKISSYRLVDPNFQTRDLQNFEMDFYCHNCLICLHRKSKTKPAGKLDSG